jgi:hypothetical protein
VADAVSRTANPYDQAVNEPDAVVRLLSFSARVFGVDAQTISALSRIYPHTERVPRAVSSAAAPLDPHAADIRLEHMVDGDAVAGPKPVREILGKLEYLLDSSALTSFVDHVVLHSGAIAAGDFGILFPAASGAGKSTLVTALCLSGFSYLSDEFAILDVASGHLLPFPKSICLKPEGRGIVDRTFDTPADVVEVCRVNSQRVSFLAPPHAYPVERRATVRYIVIPHRVAAGKAALTRLARAEALGILLQQSLNLPCQGAQGLETLVRLVEDADCLRLTYADLHDALDRVSALALAA